MNWSQAANFSIKKHQKPLRGECVEMHGFGIRCKYYLSLKSDEKDRVQTNVSG